MAGYTPRLEAYGLPSFAASDANAGLNLKRPNIGFPASSVIAATFNRDIARTVGRVVAEECRDHGVDLVLAPGMNLHRSPLCGRHPEYFSEDPCLTGPWRAATPVDWRRGAWPAATSTCSATTPSWAAWAATAWSPGRPCGSCISGPLRSPS
ncbi:glycoside hydrolase family 3 N-terminal domain-containing protein, partial [Ralstonia pseudosolanacearum]|uniref:glycoside hydrolase family 3 N-terminal domain-containing protein n=1 Tax=Ralstonia pseudosolanacearum TaxID=1310165 RepID=UPI003CF16526